MIPTRHKDGILLSCKDGCVFQLHVTYDNKPELQLVFKDCRSFRFVALLNPENARCALVDRSNNLIVLNALEGIVDSSYQIDLADTGQLLEFFRN